MHGISIALSVILTVYCQLILKWRLGQITIQGENALEKAFALAVLPLQDLWIASAFLATFGGAISWMFAISKLPISIAYPFMSLSYILVLAGAAFFFEEGISLTKIIGTVLVMLGLTLMVR